VAQYGGRVKPVALEVRDEFAAKAAVQLAVDAFGRLDVLINNAGYGQFAPFEQLSADDFRAVVDTCFYGVVYTTRAAVRKRLRADGRQPFPLPEYGRVARDRPGISHWPAESPANNVAAIGDVSAPTPSWYTPKPMEFHRAARRKTLSLRQNWWRL
jgi:NAD(P)-dependent dehydrogenase (short-subunit alcohol dehydrogenase family)